MLEKIKRDGFFIFVTRRQPIPLNVDCLNMQVRIVLFDISSESSSETLPETSPARTSILEEDMAKRPSLYEDQKPDPSDSSAYRPRQLHFSWTSLSFLDCEQNVATSIHLEHYREYYEISDRVMLALPKRRTAWNPPKGSVAIYGYMLNCGVTLPL
ncbi:hypothetical protein ACOSP7_003151 [Xanthoceras sorbifolium]